MLTGPDAGGTCSITGSNTGAVAGYTFSIFANLVGGAGNDDFQFGPAGSLGGSINGGGGVNTLDYSGYTAKAVTVNLVPGVAS